MGGHPRIATATFTFTLLGVAALLVAASGCGHGESGAAPPSASTVATGVEPSPSSAPATPVDHLAPGELVEGTEEAFGLVLPRGVSVESRLPGVVVASGPVGLKPLVTYVKERLEGGSFHPKEEGATAFEHVRPRGHTGVVDVYIGPRLGKTLIQVIQEPEVAPSTLPDEASRWRAAGLTPEGKILDPKHVE